MNEHHVQENLRFERKFVRTDLSARDLEQIVFSHPSFFREVYHVRRVNNIYFDQLGFKAFYDNIDGNFRRTKYRIRWYGELFGKVEKPILELKIKRGLMGRKESYLLSPFQVQPGFSQKELNEAFDSSGLPDNLLHLLKFAQPVLLNSYSRKYYLSEDKKYRITIDSDLKFYRLNRLSTSFMCKADLKDRTIVELKYDKEDDDLAKEIALYLDLRLTKSSKFVQGVSNLYQI